MNALWPQKLQGPYEPQPCQRPPSLDDDILLASDAESLSYHQQCPPGGPEGGSISISLSFNGLFRASKRLVKAIWNTFFNELILPAGLYIVPPSPCG